MTIQPNPCRASRYVVLLLLGLSGSVAASESTLARLSFWVPPEEMQEFEAAYEEQVVPILNKHGWVASSRRGRVTVDSVFSRLFAFETPAAVASIDQILQKDPAWQGALVQLGNLFDETAPDAPIRFEFELYQAVAGPGRTVPAGRGQRQGLWHSFDVLDGLSSPVVKDILEDRQGHLWFGTILGEGLCRYDGATFTIYTPADGLPGVHVPSILEDRNGALWIGVYDEGVVYYDGATFTTFTPADGLAGRRISSIATDLRGDIWFATYDGGVSRYDGETFATYTTQDGLAGNQVEDVCVDRAGNIWFATTGGVSRYDGETFTNYTIEDGLIDNGVLTILQDQQSHLWFGTWGGVSRYDGATFTNYTTQNGLLNDSVEAIAEDQQGHLFFGTRGGLSRYDGAQFVHFTSTDGLAGNTVWCLLVDRTGTLWVGIQGGVSHYDGARFTNFTVEDGLVGNSVMDVFEDRAGSLWFGTWSGLSRFDGAAFATIDSHYVWTMYQDRQGQLWLGDKGGRGVCSYESHNFTCYTTEDGLADNWVTAILEDAEGHMWMATNAGISRFDGETFSNYTVEDGLVDNGVWSMLEDRQGQLWFGTYDGGVSRFDGETFTNYTVEDGLVDNGVWSMLEDRQGQLWFGTQGGVSRYDGETFTNYTTQDGLTHNRVISIFEDRNGILWLGTFGGGISRYDGLVFQKLVNRDGLVDNTVHRILQAHNGDFWIATEGGVTRYRPARNPPSVRLREVIADRSYGSVDRLSLSSDRPFVRFKFQGASFTTAPDELVYAYRLKGYDKQWQAAYTGQVEYADLPAGDYMFEVKAVDRDLNYSQEPATVSMTITRPYAKMALWSSLGIALVGLVIAARYGIRRRQERDQARTDLVQVRTDLVQVRTDLVQTRRQQLAGQSHDIEQWTLDDFVEQSLGMRLLFDEVSRQQAESDSQVLITGEAGTGKELLARAMHAGSSRSSGRFVAVRCALLPADVTQLAQRTKALSQLFGYVEGAFAGAERAQEGYLQQAKGGTLFFDEIGLVPLPLQSHLLRVLTQGEVRRVGTEQAEGIDLRVLAATSMDLAAQVASGAFHAEWHEYLVAQRLEVPPLRERPEDIALLAQRFAQALMRKLGQVEVPLEAAVVEQLQSYGFPGNVRELKSLIEAALIESGGRSFGVEYLHISS